MDCCLKIATAYSNHFEKVLLYIRTYALKYFQLNSYFTWIIFTYISYFKLRHWKNHTSALRDMTFGFVSFWWTSWRHCYSLEYKMQWCEGIDVVIFIWMPRSLWCKGRRWSSNLSSSRQIEQYRGHWKQEQISEFIVVISTQLFLQRLAKKQADIFACLLDLNFKQSKLTRLNFSKHSLLVLKIDAYFA